MCAPTKNYMKPQEWWHKTAIDNETEFDAFRAVIRESRRDISSLNVPSKDHTRGGRGPRSRSRHSKLR